MALITSVNGKTGTVVIKAEDVKTDASSQKTVESALTTGYYTSTVTKIENTEDYYLLTITKKI